MAAKPPPAICTECGSIIESAVAVEYWQDAVVDAAIQRRGKKQLLGERDRSIKNHPHYDVAMEILEYWRETCRPHAKELENERLTLCLARLDAGNTPDQLKRAVYGYSLKPFMVNGRRTHQGPRDAWYADATLIFRSEKHVAAGIDIAERASELRTAFSTNGGPPQKPLSVLGEAALRIARVFPVFPVKPRDKTPLTKHGLKDAKQAQDAIRAFWSRVPDANIGVPTGKVSGFVVLDVDGDSGFESLRELEAKYEDLPNTKSVKTPGGGSHLFFQHPNDREIRNSASLLGPALDVRGDGGYVLVPPSIGSSGRRYVADEEGGMMPMPDWLLKLIEERQNFQNESLRSGDLEMFFSIGATSGNRNDRLFRYACSINQLPPDKLLFAVQAANKAFVKPPLEGREVDGVVKSALKYRERNE